MIKRVLLYVLLLLPFIMANAQERVGPLLFRPHASKSASGTNKAALKTTALTLPFFDDFTYYDNPDSNKWQDNKVYINNTMGNNPITWGVATFDALTEYGLPYNFNANAPAAYADSLTSKPIDLSAYQPSDSIYLSFFYQPKGNGASPEGGDSLFLYFRRKTTNPTWQRVWSVGGSSLMPFTQVMVSVAHTDYFHPEFQFRFVNKVSLTDNDDNWNIDYVRLDRGRNMYDTTVNDVAFTTEPGFMLNDYTYMPYHQFMVNPSGELAAKHGVNIRNLSTIVQNVTHGYDAREQVSNTPLSNSSPNTLTLNPQTTATVDYNVYSTNVPGTGAYQRVVFENRYFIEGGIGPANNDTIVHEQRFENYFAYDDGSAERSYYLNLFPTLPGKTAVEYHLNRKDTLLGVAIYFGRQLPFGANKDFSVAVYKELGMNGNSDQVVFQQNFLLPGYLNTNEFYFYKFDSPVVLDQGTFYMGTVQPASGVSDSLQLGLDANRAGGNHLYYNVSGYWESSTVSGALMIRPVVGWIIPSKVEETKPKEERWTITPNPATDKLKLDYHFDKSCTFEISDVQGRSVMYGFVPENREINISTLAAGSYFISLHARDVLIQPKKIIKL